MAVGTRLGARVTLIVIRTHQTREYEHFIRDDYLLMFGIHSNKPFTCVGGRKSGSKCHTNSVTTDCPASVALTSCTASMTSVEDRFLNDLAIKQVSSC